MKRFPTLLLLALLVACSGPASDTDSPSGAATSAGDEPLDPLTFYAPGADRSAVVGTVQLLFDALRYGDADLLRRVVDPSVMMHFAEVRSGDVTFGSSTVDALVTRIESAEEPLVERMWDPVVLVNGPMATVWAPYDFYVGDTFTHCGVDTASLMRTDDGWRIVALSWTRLQPPACEMHPDGPPA